MSSIDDLMKDLVEWNKQFKPHWDYWIDVVIASNQADGTVSVYLGKASYTHPWLDSSTEWLFGSHGSLFFPTKYGEGKGYHANFNWVNSHSQPPYGKLVMYGDDQKTITETVIIGNLVLSNGMLSGIGARANQVTATYVISFQKDQGEIIY